MKFPLLFCLCILLLAACGAAPTSPTATAAPLPTGLPSPTQAQLPTSTPTQAPSPTPAGLTYCIVPHLLNLRSGPGIDYSIVVIEGQNTCGLATARNADSKWVYITIGKYSGWAYVQYLSGEGDINTLPVSTNPTPPAASPTPAASATKTP